MRRSLRLAAAIALAASGLIVAASPSQAEPVEVIDCGSPVHTPAVGVPEQEPAPGVPLLGEGDTCAELVRTLVFVGVAEIDNGVNFNGVGGTSAQTYGSYTQAELDAGYTPQNGGTYKYDGDCVMVNWENPVGSSGPAEDPVVGDCAFGTVGGFFKAPDTPDPIFNPIGNGLGAGHQALAWAPADEASCLSSSGKGTASFESTSPAALVSETWTSSYEWNNSLRNLRGSITDGARTFPFDAKIEAHANPQASGGPLDQTDAGCLQRPLAELTGGSSNHTTGLNSILITGTATWRSSAPELFSE